jgi:hypothetical protein
MARLLSAVLRKIGSARKMGELPCDDCRMFNSFSRLSSFVRNLRTIVSDGLSFFAGVWRHHTALAAENLFLRKQLAPFREREKKSMPTTPADRFVFSQAGSLVRLA